jgi:hypothetical protein
MPASAFKLEYHSVFSLVMSSAIRVGRLGVADVDEAAEILHDAFEVVYRKRGHLPPFPSRDSASWLCRAYMDLDPDGCAIARVGSEAVGVGFAHPRGAVTSIGPLAAKPGAPPGVARALMKELEKVAAGSVNLRLFQDSFNPDSFGLYTRLGYVVADVAPYLLAERLVAPPEPPPQTTRAFTANDLSTVARYDRARTGSDRRPDLTLLSSAGGGFVSEVSRANGDVNGYLFFRTLPARVVIGPGVAESEDVLAGLVDAIASALPGHPAVIRASAASPRVLERAFARGFRIDHLGNLMVSGPFQPPPSQLYALFPESL